MLRRFIDEMRDSTCDFDFWRLCWSAARRMSIVSWWLRAAGGLAGVVLFDRRVDGVMLCERHCGTAQGRGSTRPTCRGMKLGWSGLI